MRKSKITFILIFLSSFVLAQKTENVIILVIDGARYSETFGDVNHQYVDKMWNLMKPEATIYTQFYNNGITTTCSGHASIITGTWQNISNDGSERPHSPTGFEYFRKHTRSIKTDNYVILGKSKLDILAYSDHFDSDSIYGASVKHSILPYSDTQTLSNLKEVMVNYHPKLMITNFSEVDSKGHSGVYNGYLSAIKQVDSIVYNLWNFIQSDSIYANKTTLIITNDHGRHTSDFTSHGDACEGCRHIMLMVLGPDTPKGMIDEKQYQQIDILPTIGKMLNFPTPYAIGSVIKSASDSLSIVYDTTHIIVHDTVISTFIDTTHFEVFDTIPVIVYDTLFTHLIDTTNIIVFDTLYTTKFDTISISVTDTLIIDVKFNYTNSSLIEDDIKVFPNPAKDKLVLKMNDNSFTWLTNCRMKIMDMHGKQIYTSKIDSTWYELSLLDWGGPGTYILQIIDETGMIKGSKTIILY